MTAATLAAPQAVVIAPPDLPRDEWLKVRRRGIGSSDAAAVLGFDPHRGAAHVYLDKTGALDDEDAGEAAYWGTVLEEPVARRFAEKSGLTVLPAPGTLQHFDRPWQLANLDRLVGDDAFLECKTTSVWNDDGWLDDEIPDRVELQVAHQFAVTGYERAFVAVLIGGQKFRWYEIKRDDALVEQVVAAEAAFWQRVLDLRPPDFDGLEQTTALLARLWKVDVGAATEVDPLTFFGLKAAYDAAHAEEKAAKARKAEAANQIKALLQDKEIGLVDGAPVVTWKQHERAGYTVPPSTYRSIHFPKQKVTRHG